MNNPQQLALNFDREPETLSIAAGVCSAADSPDVLAEEPSRLATVNAHGQEYEGVEIDRNGFLLCPQTDAQGRNTPIPYELKVSAKARQVYLRVEPGRGLQVTIPRRYPKRSIPALVESQRNWLTEALVDLDNKTPAIYRQWPPPQLHLQARGSMVNVHYRRIASSMTKAYSKWASPTELLLDVDITNKPLVAKCIARALREPAYDLLGPWLDGCSIRSQLQFKRLVIRGQRTVWGSYSSSGTLSLNYKLLFLEPELVDYVLLHELAHIRHLDHSAAFWEFLEALKPNALELDQLLKESGHQVPPWLELAASV